MDSNGNGDDNDDEFDINYSADNTYRRLVVSGKFKINIMRKIRYPIIASINRDTG